MPWLHATLTCKSRLIDPLATPVEPRKAQRNPKSLVVALNLHLLDNVALLRDVHTVQELFAMSESCASSGKCQAGKVRFECLTLRISLFRTLQICWMSAALWETASRELPVMVSSSFWPLETSTSTPPCMVTRRTSFSPMKFLCVECQPISSPIRETKTPSLFASGIKPPTRPPPKILLGVLFL